MFNKPSEKINLNSPDPNSDIYISEGERFNKDFAAYDYNRRNIEHERKKEMYQNRKNQLYERERKRWEKMDYEYLRAENKIMMNKERNLVGRKNNPGMAFNPLTLQYDNSVQGEILKKRDDESKFRALMRATNIDKHANAGYNIINGEERTIMENRMLKEIEPSVYKKNINKINEINQRHNDNDNFYTKGPYTQPKTQYQPIQEQNYYNNDYQPMPNERKENDFNNVPPKDNNYQKMTPSHNDNQQMMQNDNNYNNNVPQNIPPNDMEYKKMTPNSMPPNDDYQRNTPNNFNNIPPNDNYQRKTPNDYNNMPPNDNYQRNTPNNYNNLPPNENYQRNTPNNYNNMPPNGDYQRNTPNNYNNMPPNENYQRNTPNNNYDNVQDGRGYNRTPYSDNNYRKMTPSNHGYNQQQNEDFQQIPDHYSEQDRRYNTMRNDFDRQYNYIDDRDQNNYDGYKNQGYNNERPITSPDYNPRDGDYNKNRDPYARPDYYANNRSRALV
jgi:hypothetical protein